VLKLNLEIIVAGRGFLQILNIYNFQQLNCRGLTAMRWHGSVTVHTMVSSAFTKQTPRSLSGVGFFARRMACASRLLS